MLGVISYLPDDANKREMRKSMIKKALLNNSCLFKYEKDKYVILQNYTKKEAEVWKGFTKIYRKPLGAAKARNILLDILENSDSRWLWLMDDDIMFYDYYGISKMVREFNDNPRLEYIDIVTFLDPRFRGFRNILDGKKDIDRYIYFLSQQTMNTSTNSYLIRNARQANKKSIRFIEDYKEKQIREDIAFLLDNLDEGKVLLTCPEIVFKWDSADGGTIKKNKSSQEWIFQLPPHQLEKGLAKKYGLSYNAINGNINFGRYKRVIRRLSKSTKVRRMYPLVKKEYTVFSRKRRYTNRRRWKTRLRRCKSNRHKII